MKMDFCCEELTPVKWWMRLTLPFAIIIMTFIFIYLPFHFIFTGNWGYSVGKSSPPKILNWFRALKLQ